MLLLSTILLVGAHALLPLFLENLIARDLQGQLGLTEEPELSLESRLPSALAGRFQGGRAILEPPGLGGARPDAVTVDLEPFDLDVLESVTSGRIKSEEPLSGSLRAELSEEEVARMAASSGTTMAPVRAVELEEGWMIVDSEVWAFEARVPVSMEGSLVLRNGALVFAPDQIEAFGAPVPKRLTRGLLRGVDLSYPIDASLFGLTFSVVELHKDRLVLSGEVDDLPVG